MTLNNNTLHALPSHELLHLAEFVVDENFKHHTGTTTSADYQSDVISIYNEELKYYKNSQVFVSKNHYGSINGAIRVLRWNYKDILPIEKIFGIKPLQIVGISPLKSIFHIGRFAINKEQSGIQLFKALMVSAIAPICQNKNSVAFAECDSKLLKILALLGIKTTIIGEPTMYLGSETIPVCMSHDGLIDFYRKNSHLIHKNSFSTQPNYNTLPQRVVFDNQADTTLTGSLN